MSNKNIVTLSFTGKTENLSIEKKNQLIQYLDELLGYDVQVHVAYCKLPLKVIVTEEDLQKASSLIRQLYPTASLSTR